MATKIRQMQFVIYPTDNRMTCKRYGFEWVVTIPDRDGITNTKDWYRIHKLQVIASEHLGRYTSFPLSYYDKRYGSLSDCRFAVRYHHQSYHITNNRLYFRTQEDVDHVIMLYALTVGEDL